MTSVGWPPPEKPLREGLARGEQDTGARCGDRRPRREERGRPAASSPHPPSASGPGTINTGPLCPREALSTVPPPPKGHPFMPIAPDPAKTHFPPRHLLRSNKKLNYSYLYFVTVHRAPLGYRLLQYSSICTKFVSIHVHLCRFCVYTVSIWIGFSTCSPAPGAAAHICQTSTRTCLSTKNCVLI